MSVFKIQHRILHKVGILISDIWGNSQKAQIQTQQNMGYRKRQYFIISLFHYLFLLLFLNISPMDEQQSMFNLEEFNADYEHHSPQNNLIQDNYAESHQNQTLTLKAFNPQQYAQNLPPKDQQKYLSIMMNHKSYLGLTHFINFDKSQEMPDNLNYQNVDRNDWIENNLHLQQLFQNQDTETIKRRLQQIQQEIKSINKKSFSEININHTIIPSFSENFDNFKYLNSHINFIKDLQIKMISFMEKTIDFHHDENLIIEIYQFWMRAFTDFVLSIKKHTERYTLTFMKKTKDNSESNSNKQGKSTSSSRMLESEKRRAWKPSQLELIEKVINSNSAFNQTIINKVAQQLNRTPASVSSKIQKILKDHKAHNPDYEIHQNMTLVQKIINVLRNYPEGLSREGVIQRVNEHYQMGYDMNWSKSVAQILSSRPQFCRIKGTYSLNGIHKVDMSKKTFKDKVVNCLLTVQEGKADLKRLVEQYINLYGTTQGISILSDQRIKTIEASISKSLCRYDIFNKQKSKTVYKLRQFCNQNQYLEEQIKSYIL